MNIKSILIVEDCELTGDMLKYVFSEEAGLLTSRVCSVKEAKRYLNSHQFDVVLTDFELQDGSGLEVAKHSVELSPERPVFLLTGTPMDIIRDAVERSGISFTEIYSKPANIIELMDKVMASVGLSDCGCE